MVEIRIERTALIGKVYIYDVCILQVARSKKFSLEGNILTIKGIPHFTSFDKWGNWLKNHFPKKSVEKFLTASLRQGKVRILEVG